MRRDEWIAQERREIPACGRQASLRSLRKITQGRQDDDVVASSLYKFWLFALVPGIVG
jgi:hypothetical protein